MRKVALVAAAVAAMLPSASAFFGGSLPALARAGPANALTSVEMTSHGYKKAKLNLPADQRKALFRSLTTEVIRHGRITTTQHRAKAIRGEVDRMIGLAKDGSLAARRKALGYMYDKNLVHALFEQAPERYADRNGGYCRVVRTMPRQGDNAKMAVIELV